MRNGLYERVRELDPADQSTFLRRALDDPDGRAHLAPSPAQRRLWFHAQLGPDTAAYHVPAAYRFLGPLDTGALRAALDVVIARHEALRSRFLAVDGEPAVLISTSVPGLVVRDLRPMPPGERTAEAEAVLARETGRPFDLAAGPLVRCLLVRLDDQHHILLINAHHIVLDGVSWAVIRRELSAAYAAFAEGDTPDLPGPALQYQDFTAWQAQAAAGEDHRVRLEHQKQALASASPALDLPADHLRPAGANLRAASVSEPLAAAAIAGLTSVTRRNGGTPPMGFLAGWVATLSRYSGSADILVGLAHAGRPRADFADVVGMFVNTLAVRAQVPPDPAFEDVLRGVRAGALDAYSRADVPFDTLIEQLPHARVGDRHPLFQAFFSYHPAGEDRFALGGLAGEPIEQATGWTPFDVELAVQIRDDGSADLLLIYAADVFGERTARRMLADVRLILENAGAGRPLGELPPSGPPVPPPVPAVPPSAACLHELLDAGFRRHPERVAVVFGDHRLAYREIDAAANRLAHHLREQGVGPGTLVGVALGRTPRLLVTVFAVLRAGGAYVPLDPAQPVERLSAMVRDSDTGIVVTENSCRDLFGEFAGTVVSLDEDAARIAGQPGSAVPRTAGPGDAAYVMFTSGSTGRAKGVLVEHRSVVGLVDFYRTRFGVEETAGVLASTSAGFDASILEWFTPLLFGGTVVLVDSLLDLHQMPGREHITLVQGVPSIMDELLRAGPLPPSVTTVVLSGEVLTDELVIRVFAESAVRRIWNVYGVTEYTADATWKLLEPGRSAAGLGEPLPGLRTYVLDEKRRPCPPGARGELYLAGPGLARGYLNRPELTGERFLPDPFTGEDGALMYRTGDLVRHRWDDELEYLGRLDNQVKIHGCRVEPAEVEAVLREHPDVARAAVVVRDAPSGDRALAAYAVPVQVDVDPHELRRHLARKLPAYMVPAVVTLVRTLPLNANGKLDIASLPESAPAPASAFTVAPRTPAERSLARIWGDVLDRADVGVDDDFFEAGGHSLRALRLVARIKQEYGVAISVAGLFQTPTIAAVAALIESRRAPDNPSWVVLRPGGTRVPIVLAPAVGGSALSYADLARVLPDGRPVYGLQAPGLDDGSEPLRTIPDLAACYLEQLERARLDGPIVLGGWSMGGAVAYEMAHRAIAAGRPVSGLFMLDTHWPAPDTMTGLADQVSLYSQYLLASAPHLERSVTSALPASVAGDPAGPGPVVSLRNWACRIGLIGEEITSAQLGRMVAVFGASMRALDVHTPAALDVPALFVAAAGTSDGNGVQVIREALKSAPRVETVAGDHYSLLRAAGLEAIAGRIATWLTELG